MKRFVTFITILFASNYVYAEIKIENDWARTTPNGMGAVYFEIKNTSDKDDFLIKASSPNAKSVMIHETQRTDNITNMKHHSSGKKIPANNKVFFQPGGFHLMLSKIDGGLELGDKIRINLEFKNNETISIEPRLKILPPIK